MFKRLLARVGVAALAAGTALAVPMPAQAQHRGGVGHAGVGHVGVGRVGGVSRAYVAPRGAYVNRGVVTRGAVGTNYRRSYGAYSYYRPGYRYGSGYGYGYGGYYGYRYPGVGLALGLGLGAYPYYGSFGYGYGYPYSNYGYYGSSYPYADSSTYVAPTYSDTTVVTPATTTSAYAAEQSPPPVSINAARIVVQLPANATLLIDGQPTQQTGPVRIFDTPPTLQPGQTYPYKLEAQWVQDGQPVVRDRDITFQAGSQVVVNMNIP